MKTTYRITRLFTIAFYLYQLLGSSLALYIMFIPIFVPALPASKTLLLQYPHLLSSNLLDLGLIIIPMIVVVFNLIKNQKLGWVVGIGASLFWITISLALGKGGGSDLITFPIINLPLCIFGLVTYGKMYKART